MLLPKKLSVPAVEANRASARMVAEVVALKCEIATAFGVLHMHISSTSYQTLTPAH